MVSKEFLGLSAVILAFIAYIPYFRSLFKRQAKPHLFSWIIWTLVSGTVFVAQYIKGAGAGCWATGFVSLLSGMIVVFALFRGERNITRGDWVAFISGLFAIALWQVTKDPLWTVVIASSIDVFACYPTLRKSYTKPWEESAFSYSLQFARAILSLTALEHYSVITALLPSSEIFSNSLLTGMLLWRRAVLKKASQ